MYKAIYILRLFILPVTKKFVYYTHTPTNLSGVISISLNDVLKSIKQSTEDWIPKEFLCVPGKSLQSQESKKQI